MYDNYWGLRKVVGKWEWMNERMWLTCWDFSVLLIFFDLHGDLSLNKFKPSKFRVLLHSLPSSTTFDVCSGFCNRYLEGQTSKQRLNKARQQPLTVHYESKGISGRHFYWYLSGVHQRKAWYAREIFTTSDSLCTCARAHNLSSNCPNAQFRWLPWGVKRVERKIRPWAEGSTAGSIWD